MASKNNPADVLEVLDHHPEMILRRKDFAALEVHWNSKSDSLPRIAQQLNLGLDSFVFWDDEPREHEVVRNQHPVVLVPEAPADPSSYAKMVLGLECFDVLGLTEEDRRRAQCTAKRAIANNGFLPRGSGFGRSLSLLKMAVTIERPDAFAVPRVAQLTHRTNQFNFTTRRYDEGNPSEVR